jgi:hypothetical protein
MSRLMEEINQCTNIAEVVDCIEDLNLNEIDFESLKRISRPQAHLIAILKQIADQYHWKIIINMDYKWAAEKRWKANAVLICKNQKFIIKYDTAIYNVSSKRLNIEREKDLLAIENGYVVIRIREEGCNELCSGAIEIINKKIGGPSKDSIKEMLQILSHYTNTNILCDFNSLSTKDIISEVISRDEVWFYKAALYLKYVKENQTIFIPMDYEMRDVKLGLWVQAQRVKVRNGTLDFLKKEILYKIGFTIDEYSTKCDENYELAKQYYAEYGHLNVRLNESYKGVKLGSWLDMQRSRYNHPDWPQNSPMSESEISRLESIGMIWRKNYHLKDDERLNQIAELKDQGFDFNIKQNLANSENEKYFKNLIYIETIRRNRQDGKIDSELEKALLDMNIILDNSLVLRRTKLLRLRMYSREDGYIRWNDKKHYKQKLFIEKELREFRENPKLYPKEFLSLILGCGINAYSDDPFGKEERKFRKKAVDKGIPARIYYRFCESQLKKKV